MTGSPDPGPTGAAGPPGAAAVVVDLDSADTSGPAGVVWSLPHSGDLDANLVHLDPGGVIPEHANQEVDVLLSVVSGRGTLLLGGVEHALRGYVVALVPKGANREIRAGSTGLTYLSIHRRRGPLGINRNREAHHGA